MKIRKQLSSLLIWLVSWIYSDRPGYCFVKNLHGNWCIIDGMLIRQSVCLKPIKGIEWETWTLPDAWQEDLIKG